MKKQIDDYGIQAEAAERLVARAESAPLGTLPADLIAEARAAVLALLEQARRRVFPSTLTAVSAAALADFRFAIETSGSPFETLTAALTVVHAQALAEYEELAQIVRSPRAQKLVIRQALSESMGAPGADTAALDRWMVTISAQVAARPDHPLAGVAGIVCEVAPSFRSRLDAVEQRHHAHATAEAARIAREERAREQARVDAERAEERRPWAESLRSEDRDARRRREELVDFYRRHEGYAFKVDGKSISAKDCAADLLAGAPIPAYYRAQISGEKTRAASRELLQGSR